MSDSNSKQKSDPIALSSDDSDSSRVPTSFVKKNKFKRILPKTDDSEDDVFESSSSSVKSPRRVKIKTRNPNDTNDLFAQRLLQKNVRTDDGPSTSYSSANTNKPNNNHMQIEAIIDLSGDPLYDSAKNRLEENMKKLELQNLLPVNKSSSKATPDVNNMANNANRTEEKSKFTFKQPIKDLNKLSKRIEITNRVILPGQKIDPYFLNPYLDRNTPLQNSNLKNKTATTSRPIVQPVPTNKKPPKSSLNTLNNTEYLNAKGKQPELSANATKQHTTLKNSRPSTSKMYDPEVICLDNESNIPSNSIPTNVVFTGEKSFPTEIQTEPASPPPHSNMNAFIEQILNSSCFQSPVHLDQQVNKSYLDYCQKAKVILLEHVFEQCCKLPVEVWKMVDNLDLPSWVRIKSAVNSLDSRVKVLNTEIKKPVNTQMTRGKQRISRVAQRSNLLDDVVSSSIQNTDTKTKTLERINLLNVAGISRNENTRTKASTLDSDLEVEKKPLNSNEVNMRRSLSPRSLTPEIIPETQLDETEMDEEEIMMSVAEERLTTMGRGSIFDNNPNFDGTSSKFSDAKPFQPRVNLANDQLPVPLSVIPSIQSSIFSNHIEDVTDSQMLDEDGREKFTIEEFSQDDIEYTRFNTARFVMDNRTKEQSHRSLVDEIPELGTLKPSNSIKLGRFHAGIQNDGLLREYDGFNFDHSQELKLVFQNTFGLRDFRPNQLQAINATLLGHDCFVLMPTGGGKSLCYQLPAVLRKGVTIVISPLRSLIIDQTSKLNSLDINTAYLSSDVSMEAATQIYKDLESKTPKLKLLYVTPEKICASPRMQNVLKLLFQNGNIARFVIDEAHCVSQWGHDFRPDYKKLHILRQSYPDIPIMALTATANPRVRLDILKQLNIDKLCKWYLCSFNRPNLKYIVYPKKGSTTTNDIIALIKSKFPRASGIIYCLSRKECDEMAYNLSSAGLSAESYHAGLADQRRETVQKNWIADRIRIVCATIAFGMGIDKPDVRFVLHYCMPKSIENYYQESGRAGRDGEVATCILYYNYSDMQRYKKMMDQDNTVSYEAKQIHLNNLNRIVSYCENITDCRRQQQLEYFAEHFTRDECLANKNTACDNCLKQDDYKIIDATEDCRAAVRCVNDLCSGNKRFTLLHIADVLKGSNIKKILDNGHNRNQAFGRLKSWDKNDINRLLHKMVIDEFLREELIFTNDIPQAYARIGSKVEKLMSTEIKIDFPITEKISSRNRKDDIAEVSDPIENAELKALTDDCYDELLKTCQEIANEKNVQVSSILKQEALKEMSRKLPTSEIEMLKLQYVTKANFDKYGHKLLDILQRYAAEKIVLVEEIAETNNYDNNYESEDWTAIARAASVSNRGTKRRGNFSNITRRYKRPRTTKPKRSPKTKRGSSTAKKTSKFNPCTFLK